VKKKHRALLGAHYSCIISDWSKIRKEAMAILRRTLRRWLSKLQEKSRRDMSKTSELFTRNEKSGQSFGTKHGTVLIFGPSRSQSRATRNGGTFVTKYAPSPNLPL
jgi:hypothetical protein